MSQKKRTTPKRDESLCWRVIHRDGLNVRASNEQTSEIVGSLEYGDIIVELEQSRDYIRHQMGWTTMAISYDVANFTESVLERVTIEVSLSPLWSLSIIRAAKTCVNWSFFLC
jgi:hypothetical protein